MGGLRALIDSSLAWPVGGFAAILLHLLLESLEYAGTLRGDER